MLLALLCPVCGCAAAPPATTTATPCPSTALPTGASSSVGPTDVVARWTGGQLAYEDLLAQQSDAFQALSARHARQRHLLERDVLRELIDQQLIDQAARTAGKPRDEFVRDELAAVTVHETELRSFYDEHLQDGGTPFETVAPRIREHLLEEKRATALRALMDELEVRADARLTLPPPPEAVARFNLAGRPTKGAAHGRLTIVIFADFQCPFCAVAHRAMDELIRGLPGDVKIYALHYPLGSHEAAFPAALAAECAHQQGRFWAMSDRLFQHQRTLAPDVDVLLAHAQTLGLETEAFQSCLLDPNTRETIQNDVLQGEASGVEGTPSVFVNGILHDGVPTAAELRLLR